jgi:hypothetical protein
LRCNEHSEHRGALCGLRALGLLEPASPDQATLAELLGFEAEPAEPRWLAPKPAIAVALGIVAHARAVRRSRVAVGHRARVPLARGPAPTAGIDLPPKIANVIAPSSGRRSKS